MFSAIKPFLDLCRVSNLPTVWTNVLCAIVLADRFGWPSFILLSISLSLFYAGGMCLNDVCDVAIDSSLRSLRPIPSCRLSLRSAWILTAVLFAAAFCPLCVVPYPSVIWSGLALLATIVCYDKYHKRHASSVFLMAACRWLVFLVSAIAVSGTVSLYVHIAALAQFVYVVLISLVARWEYRRAAPFVHPVIPWMIACISLLDGLLMAIFISPLWALAGIGGTVLTSLGQKYVRGD